MHLLISPVAAREWHTTINPAGDFRFIWHMPGTRNFAFNKTQYILSRIYRLTGDYPGPPPRSLKVPRCDEDYHSLARYYETRISGYGHSVSKRFELTRDDHKLPPHDRAFAEKVSYWYHTDLAKYSSRAEQDAEFWRKFDASLESKRHLGLVNTVIGAMRRNAQLVTKFLEVAEKEGTVVLREGMWVLPCIAVTDTDDDEEDFDSDSERQAAEGSGAHVQRHRGIEMLGM